MCPAASPWSDAAPDALIAAATIASAFVFILVQRRIDRSAQRDQQAHDAQSSSDAEVVEGVIAVWGAATRVMNTAYFLSQRVVQRYRFGQLVGPHLLEMGRALGDLIAGYTRVAISGDRDLIRATERVLAAGQRFEGTVGGAPWWNPWRARRRNAGLEKAFNEMAEALLDLRDLTRTKLGRELPDLTTPPDP